MHTWPAWEKAPVAARAAASVQIGVGVHDAGGVAPQFQGDLFAPRLTL